MVLVLKKYSNRSAAKKRKQNRFCSLLEMLVLAYLK